MTRILRTALLAVVLAGAGLIAAHPARADDWHGWHRGDDRGDGWRGGWHRRWGDDDDDWRGGWGVVVAPRAYYPPPPVYYAPPPPPPVFFAPGLTVGIGFH
jgi:hypothetical protein